MVESSEKQVVASEHRLQTEEALAAVAFGSDFSLLQRIATHLPGPQQGDVPAGISIAFPAGEI